MTDEDSYAATVFLDAVLPLVKVIADSVPSLGKAFAGRNGFVTISVRTPGGTRGTHFVVLDGDITVRRGVPERSDVELEFATLAHFLAFFRGKSKKLPRVRGLRQVGLLAATFRVLLKMAALLQATKAPKDESAQALVVRLYFYLLATGISRLAKVGHPEIAAWAKASPDRVYAWRVDDHDEVAAYLRVKAGKTVARRGVYRRAKPFFTMRFDCLDSALGILLERDDLLESTKQGKLMMEGGPEFGAQIGAYMQVVGALAK